MIDQTVRIDESHGAVEIAPTAEVAPYAVITGPCVIGHGVYIGAHAVIGAPAQHHGTWPAPLTGERRGDAGVEVHPGACIREFATVHQGLVVPTIVGVDCLVMAGCHIAHDCQVGRDVTIGSFSVFGGFTMVRDRVTFGQNCVTHPWVVIGEGAMVGLNSSVLRDVEPYEKVAGAPIRALGRNDKKLADTVLSSEVWDQHARALDQRDERKAAWYA